MKYNKAYKFRIYPNKEQQKLIEINFNCCRFIYNKILEKKLEYYKKTKKEIIITPAQYKQRFEWLKDADSYALSNEQIYVQYAFHIFLKSKGKIIPKFKSKKREKKRYTTSNTAGHIIRINNYHQIHLCKLGWVRFVEHRSIPQEYKIKSATISQEGSGKYYISILTEYEYDNTGKILDRRKSIGLDYSSHDFYVDNQNNVPENLRHYYRNLQKKLAFHQRRLSHMKKDSNNYKRQKIIIAKICEKIANQRKDFIEKESTKIIKLYDIICIEDIDLKEMSHTLKLGKSTLDNAFGMFRIRLEQKAKALGKRVVKIDKWFPSSKKCHNCGFINHSLKLSDRKWVCPKCGSSLNRDENAAINILHEGLRIFYK